jgi:hypothetical protein
MVSVTEITRAFQGLASAMPSGDCVAGHRARHTGDELRPHTVEQALPRDADPPRHNAHRRVPFLIMAGARILIIASLALHCIVRRPASFRDFDHTLVRMEHLVLQNLRKAVSIMV